MQHFVLQAEKKLEEDQRPYSIPGCKDTYMNEMAMIPPTDTSVKNGLLEWVIDNNPYNQSHISKHYSHFKILKSETVALMSGFADIEANEPEPIMDATDIAINGITQINDDGSQTAIMQAMPSAEVIEITDETPKKVAPNKVAELKKQRREQLAELKINAPAKATLKQLDDLLKVATSE